ncbi:Dynein heavy chain-like protein [Frankliniella fusca]|uniref:Dynein heavy chain-like protein n=1 Tax=Frankliniella fusca TaxID=407009 RepID=A0AAE1HFU1_9NEOP|nr:Dynein heavy chain-like protein [Frankliniella fusca]
MPTQALILWPKDGKHGKTGIEPIKNVPQNSRFEGACGPVRFSGDKKFYPAKVLLISDDESVLEAKAEEVAQDILKKADAGVLGKRKRSSKKDSRLASEKAVALALGERASVPKHLEHVHKAATKERKDARVSKTNGNNMLDTNVLSSIRKKLEFEHTSNDSRGKNDNDFDDDDDDDDCDEDSCDEEEKEDEDREEDDKEDEVMEEEMNLSQDACPCDTCNLLKRYDQRVIWTFLSELSLLCKKKEAPGAQYLEFLPIPQNESKVEIGKGVFLRRVDRDQLRVDFRNKPKLLARETLFAFYGKETFQLLNVTGRGRKAGTYTIPKPVLTSVCSFVNKNVDEKKMLKSTELATLINKRAKEWRKTCSLPKKTPRKSKQCSSDISIISTSPFKATPLRSQYKSLSSLAPECSSAIFTAPTPAVGSPAAALSAGTVMPPPQGPAEWSGNRYPLYSHRPNWQHSNGHSNPMPQSPSWNPHNQQWYQHHQQHQQQQWYESQASHSDYNLQYSSSHAASSPQVSTPPVLHSL